MMGRGRAHVADEVLVPQLLEIRAGSVEDPRGRSLGSRARAKRTQEFLSGTPRSAKPGRAGLTIARPAGIMSQNLSLRGEGRTTAAVVSVCGEANGAGGRAR